MGPIWGQHGADRTRWVLCWPHELCYLGVSAAVVLSRWFRVNLLSATEGLICRFCFIFSYDISYGGLIFSGLIHWCCGNRTNHTFAPIVEWSCPGDVAQTSPTTTLHWRHNDHDGVSNHQPHGCLLNRLFRRRSKKTSKLRITGLCVGNSPGPVNSPHKGPVTRKMFPFDDVITTGATKAETYA